DGGGGGGGGGGGTSPKTPRRGGGQGPRGNRGAAAHAGDRAGEEMIVATDRRTPEHPRSLPRHAVVQHAGRSGEQVRVEIGRVIEDRQALASGPLAHRAAAGGPSRRPRGGGTACPPPR